MASTARAIGPTLGGFMYAWSQVSGLGWPFDHRFLWNVLTLLVVLTLVETRLLPESINRKKVAPPPVVELEEDAVSPRETRV